MSSSRGRGAFALLVRVAVFMLLFGGVAEVWFRTVMPACEVPRRYQDGSDLIERFDPASKRHGFSSFGRLCRDPVEWRINNAGWLSAQDYSAGDGQQHQLVALFGDSYVEGLMTIPTEHVDTALMEILDGSVDCYSFGSSGWYLEQYVAVAQYVRDMYQPDVLVFVVGAEDVKDSVRDYGVLSPTWFQITRSGKSYATVSPNELYTGTLKGTLASRSQLLNYLRYNANVSIPGMHGRSVEAPQDQSASGAEQSDAGAVGTPSLATRELLAPARYLVKRLCQEHPGVPVVFLANGPRYVPLEELSHVRMNPGIEAISTACRSQPQCSFIDLTPVFSRDWAYNHQRFEAVDGGHWNAYGNRLVAQTLADYLVSREFIDATSGNK